MEASVVSARPPEPEPHGGWWNSLKLRLAAASLVLTLLSVFLTTSLVLTEVGKSTERTILDLAHDEALHTAQVAASRLRLLSAALEQGAAALGNGDLSNDARARAALAGQPMLMAAFSAAFVVAPDGRMNAWFDDTGVRTLGISAGDRDYFKAAIESTATFISEPFVGRATNMPVIVLSRRIVDASGHVIGVLGGVVRINSHALVQDLVASVRGSSAQKQVFLVNGVGRIVAHSNPALLLHDADDEPALSPQLVERARAGALADPAGGAVFDGEHFVAYAGVPGRDWAVVTAVPRAVAMWGIEAGQARATRVGASVAVAGVVANLILLTMALRPLARLERRVQRLSDPEVPINAGWPEVSGEIGELSRVLRNALLARDATTQENAELVRRLRSTMDAAPLGIAVVRDGRFDEVNQRFETLFGYPDGALGGVEVERIFAPQLGDSGRADGDIVGSLLDERTPHNHELQLRRRDNSSFWGRLLARPVDARNAAFGAIWIVEDVSRERREREELAWSASRDPLTRLLNRRAFEEQLDALLARRPDAMPSALLFIDLDRFKAINDHGGHAAGDGVLCRVAECLVECVRGSDLVARLGGDEFAVLLVGCDPAHSLLVADKIRLKVGEIGIDAGGQRLTVGASIGVVGIDENTTDTASALRDADGACYAAKRVGRNAVRVAQGLAAL